jgi:isochorismate synthase
LVRVEGTRIQATCLAGSAPRGASEGEDQRLGEALLASGKERHEHALVLDALRDALAPVCRELTIPEAPVLLQTRNIQHLHTPLEGVLADSATVLELVELLHPTPASAGLPRAGALALLRTQEAFDRGWYAGPVGWMDRTGSGEFVVAIRSALVAEQEASLYAGCGIVAGSDPDQEYAESSLKLMPMLWALNTTTT